MTLKQERMAERIREILSELFLFEVNDPRLGEITVTRVVLDREIQYAQVYVNALGDESRREEILAGLRSAKGFLRREVAARVRLRSAPDLVFHWDFNLEHGERINRVLDDLDIPAGEDDGDGL
jgi:ribosome-binding factor A